MKSLLFSLLLITFIASCGDADDESSASSKVGQSVTVNLNQSLTSFDQQIMQKMCQVLEEKNRVTNKDLYYRTTVLRYLIQSGCGLAPQTDQVELGLDGSTDRYVAVRRDNVSIPFNDLFYNDQEVPFSEICGAYQRRDFSKHLKVEEQKFYQINILNLSGSGACDGSINKLCISLETMIREGDSSSTFTITEVANFKINYRDARYLVGEVLFQQYERPCAEDSSDISVQSSEVYRSQTN